ncbi:MAG: ABC transporter permease [Acidimicrobiales bacterium]
MRLLVSRDLTVRYKRSLLGVTWTVLNPLLTSVVMWIIFNHLFHSRIPGRIPYLVYLLSGLLAVTYFQQGITMTAASLASSAAMLTKVYVPPVVFAFSAACGGALNFLFGLIPLMVFQLIFRVGVAWTIVVVPIPLVFLLATIAGIGFFLATFVIRFDDVLNLVNVLLILVGYLTPTFFPISIVPAHFRPLFYLNPLYSYVVVFRFLEYGGAAPSSLCYLIIVLTGVVGFAIGLVVFVRRWPQLAVLL